MPRRRNILVRSLSSGFTRAYLRIGRRLPLPFNRALAVFVGRILARLVPRVKQVAMANLDLAFGDSRTPAEKARIYRGAVDNIALVAAEFPHLDRIAAGSAGRPVTLEGLDQLVPGQGYLCIGAHIGNWELMAPFITMSCGYKAAVVVRPFDDPKVDRAIDALRTRGGVTTIPKDNAGRKIVRLLKEGYLVGILIDQSPRENGVPVTFFDAPCWATIAPVMIAVRAKVPILPVTSIRNERGEYTLHFYPPLEMTRTGDLRADLVYNSQRCQDAVEAIVRETPEQWLWLHRRWKERPRLAEEWARKQARDR